MSSSQDKDELLVIRQSDLKRLLGAAESVLHTAQSEDGSDESVVPQEFLGLLKGAADSIKTRTVADSIRYVKASGEDAEDPVVAFIPPGMSNEDASKLMDQAARRAVALSADGLDLGYFEVLEESLAEQGIFVAQDIPNLESGPWDVSKDIPEYPGKVDQDDPEWAAVELSSSGHQDSDVEWEMTLADGSPVEFVDGEVLSFLGFVKEMTYRFPRADRYGIPKAATDDGARIFIVDELGFACAKGFEVHPVDTRDDSADTFVAKCIIPRDILRPKQAHTERQEG